MMTQKDKRVFWWATFTTVMVFLMINVAGVIYGNLLVDPLDRSLTCLALAGLAVIYMLLEKTRAMVLFGIIEIVAGMWSNFIQLGSLASPTHGGLHERVAILVGGVLLMSHGMKHLKEFHDKSKLGSSATSRSNVSSVTPNPAVQVLATDTLKRR